MVCSNARFRSARLILPALFALSALSALCCVLFVFWTNDISFLTVQDVQHANEKLNETQPAVLTSPTTASPSNTLTTVAPTNASLGIVATTTVEPSRPQLAVAEHISFIIGCRNDDYGGNPILRLRLTLQNLMMYEWKSRHNVSIEILVVEWNPISSNPHLWEFPELERLLAHKQTHHERYRHVHIRFIVVPPAFNDRISCDPDRVYCPFFEYHAKNVGLRRSKGEWKMLMNIDDLWPLNLLHLIGDALGNGTLDTNGLYQCRNNPIEIANISRYMDIDSMQVIEVEHIMQRQIYAEPSKRCYFTQADGGAFGAGGDFTMIHNHSVYSHFGGGYLEMCANHHLDTEFLMRQLKVNKLNPYYISHLCGYFHINHVQERNDRQQFTKTKDINQTHANKRIQCNQAGTGIYRYFWTNDTLPLHDRWPQIYNQTHWHWGIKHEVFDVFEF